MQSTLKIIRAVLYCLYKPSENARFELMMSIGNFIFPKYRFKWHHLNWWENKKFTEYLKKFNEDQGQNSDRRWMLYSLLRLTENVPGDTAECGVYLGASSHLVCESNLKSKTLKTHYGFDSFEGLSKPNSDDGKHWKKGDLSVSEEMCKKNLSEFSNVKLLKGWIPTQFHHIKDKKFSFVHVDVDIYEPTKDSVEFFYERMNSGAIFLCDDYGCTTCPGVDKALDEFLKEKPEKMISLPDGGGFFIKGVHSSAV